MSKKAKEKVWFWCNPCLYEPERDESSSNQNWNVFTCGPCPRCGKPMRMHFESPPPEILELRHQRKLGKL